VDEPGAYTGREIAEPEWLLEPPQAGDFKLLVSVGENTELPDDVREALDRLLEAVEEHDFIANDDVKSAICVVRATPCGGKCQGFCGVRCGSNCSPRRKVVEEGLVDDTADS
jgi:hypothetical protein